MQTLMRRAARGGCSRQITSEWSTTVSGLPEVFDEIDIVRRTVVLEASEPQSGGLARRGCEIFEELGRPAPCKEGTVRKPPFRVFGNASWYRSSAAQIRDHRFPRAWPPRGSRNKDFGLRIARGAQ